MENNKYELTIKFDGGNSGNNTNSETISKRDSEKLSNAINNIAKTQVIKPFIDTAEQIYFNNLQTNTGSSQLVERQRLLVEGVRQGINMYQAAQGGMVFANLAGLSTGAGVGLGLALYGLNFAFNIAVKQNQINNQKKIEDINIQYQRTRMGFANNKSRTGA